MLWHYKSAFLSRQLSNGGRDSDPEGLKDLARYPMEARAYNKGLARLRDADLPKSFKISTNVGPGKRTARLLKP